MVHLPSQNGVIVEIDVEEELNERGNGGDLLSYGIELVPTYILFLNIIYIDTIHKYQTYYDYGVI